VVIEEAWKSILTSAATSAGGRVYPVAVPQNPTYPLMLYRRASSGREHTLRGAVSMARPAMEVNCYAESYAAAKTLANEILAAIDGKTFALTGISLKSILVVDEEDLYDPDIEKFVTRLAFSVWFKD